jgi:hypothetical protein
MIRQLISRAEEVATSSQGSGQNVGSIMAGHLRQRSKIANGDPEQQRSMLIKPTSSSCWNGSIQRSGQRPTQLDAILLRNEYRPDEESRC